MSNQKCSHCGLVNWSDATNCKRCNALLQQFDGAVALPVVQQERPARVLGLLMIIWGAVLLAGALFIFFVGRKVDPLLLGAPVILASGVLVMRGQSAAGRLFFLGIGGMCAWIAVTKSLPLAIASFCFSGLIGLLVTRRRLPVLAGVLMVLSSLAVLGSFLIGMLLIPPAKIAWQDYRPGQGTFTVKMPSAPSIIDPQVKHFGPYTMTKHMYQSTIRGQGSALYAVADFSPVISIEGVSYERLLDAELDNIVTGTSSTLVSKRGISVAACPGLEFELKPPENLASSSPKTFGKIFMNSEHLYLMVITASENSELIAGKDEFLNPTFSYRANIQPAR